MSTDFLPQIDPARCTGCGFCVNLCPNKVLAMIHNIAVVVAPEACRYSGACQEVCPTGAISLAYEIVFSRERTRDA